MQSTVTRQDWFFVYAVESPSAPDLYHNRSERDVITHALGLAGVPCVSHCTISRDSFRAALDVGLRGAVSHWAPKVPLIHLSTHGHADGIQLSNGEFITWAELSDIVAPVNTALNGQLLLAMSCCEGYCGIRMAMRTDNAPLPFYALVGSSQKPEWSETAVAFTVFYHRLAKGAHVNEAVMAMNVATGCNHFHVEWAENSKKFYAEFLRTQNLLTSQSQLALTTADEAPPLRKQGFRRNGRLQLCGINSPLLERPHAGRTRLTRATRPARLTTVPTPSA
jgi:hypothetical protein